MNESESEFCAISCWVQDVCIQDGMRVFKLSQIWDEDNKVSFESKMAVSESNIEEFKMANII